MSLTGRDRKILTVLVVVLVIAAYWLLVLSPKRDEAAAAADRVESQSARLANAETDVARLEAARATYEDDLATVVRIGKAVPTSVDAPSLLVQLQAAADGTRIDFSSIKAGPREPASPAATTATPAADAAVAGPAGLEKVPLEFRFEGDFFDLADFFHEMKRFVRVANDRVVVSGRLMTIDELHLTSDNGFPTIIADIKATAYVSPKSADPAGATPTSGTAQAGAAGAPGSRPAPAGAPAASVPQAASR